MCYLILICIEYFKNSRLDLRAYSTHWKDKKKSNSINMGSEMFSFQVINLFLFYIYSYIFFYTFIYILFYISTHVSYRCRMDCRRRSKILGVFHIFSHEAVIQFRSTSTIAIGVSYTRVLKYPHK